MRITALKEKLTEPPRQAVMIAVFAVLLAAVALIVAVHRAG